MAKVAAQFPDDNEIAVLYAESVMDLSPWEYWQPGGREPNRQSAGIVPTLERVLARDPNHPGAISLLHPRGGGVAQNDVTAAKAEANAIAALEGADFTLLNASGVPAQDVLALARTVIEARIAQRQSDKAAAVEKLERAAALQDGLPCMEPPYWYYPVRQSHAVALMQAGRLEEAEEQFHRALKRAPNNGWSWYGLAELYRARGKVDLASRLEADLAKMWIGDRQQLDLSKL